MLKGRGEFILSWNTKKDPQTVRVNHASNNLPLATYLFL